MRKPIIWIVEDEYAISSALQLLLAHAGYDVALFTQGAAFLDCLTGATPVAAPDLILLDLTLPDMDGLDVCRGIRRSPIYIPVIMLTARSEPIDKLIGLEAGADVYFTKPYEPSELLAQIKAILRLIERHGAHTGAGGTRRLTELPLTNGPLVMWDMQHRVELDGQPLDLAPKEYELLRVLLRHPGRVFGRETLLRAVWGYEFKGDSRTVDVHVQRLRQKIEADPAQPRLLLTVRGVGYKLAALSEEQGRPHTPSGAF